jgi:hypothetical protein
MANIDNNTIWLKVDGTYGYYEPYVQTGETVTPGMLLIRTPAPGTDLVRPHDSLGGSAERLFAGEAGYHGRTMDDVYVAGERVYSRVLRSGDLVLAWVQSATPIVSGSFLMSNGGAVPGTLTLSSTPDVSGIIGILVDDYTSEPASARQQVQIV